MNMETWRQTRKMRVRLILNLNMLYQNYLKTSSWGKITRIVNSLESNTSWDTLHLTPIQLHELSNCSHPKAPWEVNFTQYWSFSNILFRKKLFLLTTPVKKKHFPPARELASLRKGILTWYKLNVGYLRWIVKLCSHLSVFQSKSIRFHIWRFDRTGAICP